MLIAARVFVRCFSIFVGLKKVLCYVQRGVYVRCTVAQTAEGVMRRGSSRQLVNGEHLTEAWMKKNNKNETKPAEDVTYHSFSLQTYPI